MPHQMLVDRLKTIMGSAALALLALYFTSFFGLDAMLAKAY